MPDIEFLSEQGEGGDAARSRRLGRALVAVAVAALVAVAAVVVGTGGGGRPRAGRAVTVAPTPARSTAVGVPLALPESVAFGPQTVDLYAVGSQVYALTPTLVGVVDRDSDVATIRPAPLGLSERIGRGKLVLDLDHHALWVVDLGGTAIGAYDSTNLDSLADAQSPYPILGAAAMDDRLWFTTAHGLYSTVAGPGSPRRVTGPRIRLGPVAADPTLHTVLAADYGSPSKVYVFGPTGEVLSTSLQVGRPDSLATVAGTLWLAGASGAQGELLRLDPVRLSVIGLSPVSGELGKEARIVATFGGELLVRGGLGGRALYCVDAHTGAFKQRWTVPPGAVALNERGLLFADGEGIRQLNARDCLAG
ncbi:MAG TPA: hypothetical protein VH395_08655 [Jatrophihabitantaceae bacterium]